MQHIRQSLNYSQNLFVFSLNCNCNKTHLLTTPVLILICLRVSFLALSTSAMTVDLNFSVVKMIENLELLSVSLEFVFCTKICVKIKMPRVPIEGLSKGQGRPPLNLTLSLKI